MLKYLINMFKLKKAMARSDRVEVDKIEKFDSNFPSHHHEKLFNQHRVLILSETAVCSYVNSDEEGTVLIRLGNPYDLLPPIHSKYSATLDSRFWDLETASSHEKMVASGAYKQIQRESIRINEFLKKNLSKKIVVHCYAGKARSSAVVVHILKLRANLEGVEFIYSNQKLWTPNFWVLKALEESSVS